MAVLSHLPPRCPLRPERSHIRPRRQFLRLQTAAVSLPGGLAAGADRSDAARMRPRIPIHPAHSEARGDDAPLGTGGPLSARQGRGLSAPTVCTARFIAGGGLRRWLHRRARPHAAPAPADRHTRARCTAAGGQRLRPPLAMGVGRSRRRPGPDRSQPALPGDRAALQRAAQRTGAGATVHRAQHPLHPLRLRPGGRAGDSLPGHRASDGREAGGQCRDHRKRAPVGLAAAAHHLRTTAGDPHLLHLRGRGRRPLHARRSSARGHACGAGTGHRTTARGCTYLGQPAPHLHPRLRAVPQPRRRSQPGGAAEPPGARHPASEHRPRAGHHPSGDLLRRGDHQLRHRQYLRGRVRLPQR